MKIEMKTEYEGYLIQWRDLMGHFSITKDGVEVKQLKTLQDCEKWITTQKRGKFKRTPVMCQHPYREVFFPAEATSVLDSEYVWVVDNHKARSKQYMKNVFPDTVENREKINQITSFMREMEKIADSIKTIKKTLSPITADMMIAHEGNENGR